MKNGLYVIYDRVAEQSGPVFEAINDGIALRQTCNVLKSLPDSLLPDYQLVKIAEYDTKNMEIYVIPHQVIDYTISLVRAKEWDGKEVSINE